MEEQEEKRTTTCSDATAELELRTLWDTVFASREQAWEAERALQERTTQWMSERARLDADIRQLEATVTNLEEERARLEKEEARLRTAIKELSDKFTETQEENSYLHTTVQELDEERDKLKSCVRRCKSCSKLYQSLG